MGTLTTRKAVKTHLGISDSSDDSLLTQLINQASSDIESRCNRTLTRETRTAEAYEIEGDTFYLDLYPVEEITAVTVDGVAVTDYTLTAKSGKMYRELCWGEAVSVTYTGGYVLETIPATETEAAIPRNMPFNLEYACILWVAGAYASRGSEHLSEEAIGPIRSVFWAEQPAVKAVVDKFRRVNV